MVIKFTVCISGVEENGFEKYMKKIFCEHSKEHGDNIIFYFLYEIYSIFYKKK